MTIKRRYATPTEFAELNGWDTNHQPQGLGEGEFALLWINDQHGLHCWHVYDKRTFRMLSEAEALDSNLHY